MFVAGAAVHGCIEYQEWVQYVDSSLGYVADGLAQDLEAAADLDSRDAARRCLERLKPTNAVLAAAVFRENQAAGTSPFAFYRRPGAELRFPMTPREAGFYRDGGHALIVRTLGRTDRPAATLMLEADLADFRGGLRRSLLLVGVIFIALSAAALAVSILLARAIARPVIELAKMAARVHAKGDYSLRVDLTTNDEFGALAANFNEMLEGIARRDRQLAEQTAFLEAVLEHAGFAVACIDEGGIIRTFNAAAERMFGYSREEIIGRARHSVFHDPKELAERLEQFGRRVGKPVGEYKAAEELARVGASAREWIGVRRDGTRFPMFLVVSALKKPDGGVLGLCAIAGDLTEAKKAEEAVRASEERFRAAAEQTGQIILDQDIATGHRIWAGAPESMIGYSLDELNRSEPSWWAEQVHPDDRGSFREQIEKLRASAGRRHLIYRFRRRDGEWLYLAETVSSIQGPSGGLTRLLSAIADVTSQQMAAESIRRLNLDLDQRVRDRTFELGQRVAEVEALNEDLRLSQRAADRAAARLQETNASLLVANQELEAFSYSVSHDLRAPLRNIAGFIELLEKQLRDATDPEVRRFLEIVRSEAVRMGTLIDDLLSFSHIGRAEMKLAVVSLGDVLAEVLREAAPDLEGREIEWRIQPLPAVMADRALVKLVVANLIANAVKFTRQRKPAVIEMGHHPPAAGEKFATFFVRDNGTGFNPQYVDKLFRVFQRLHNARDFEGTGIGLANTKRIITRHGGRIWAEGKVDAGATFFFTLRKA